MELVMPFSALISGENNPAMTPTLLGGRLD